MTAYELRNSDWRSDVDSSDLNSLSLLQDINTAARIGMTYGTREEVGTQTPQETLNLDSGSCRDLATLFIEAVRQLGFGARAVSGYLFDPVILGNPEIGRAHV